LAKGVEHLNAKDITPTAFGLIVAYLLPGLFALVTLALFFDPLADLLRSFSTAESTAGLFLLVVLLSLLLGMQLSACRWLVFEVWFLRNHAIPHDLYAALRNPEVSASFRVAIDELNRYHQFYGAQAVVMPFFFLGLGCRLQIAWSSRQGVGLILGGLFLEYVTCRSAAAGWRRYVERGTSMLREVQHGNRNATSKEEGQEEGKEEG
jgi:hypothetical protein